MLGANGKRVVEAPVAVVFAADMSCCRRVGKLQELMRKAGVVPEGFIHKVRSGGSGGRGERGGENIDKDYYYYYYYYLMISLLITPPIPSPSNPNPTHTTTHSFPPLPPPPPLLPGTLLPLHLQHRPSLLSRPFFHVLGQADRRLFLRVNRAIAPSRNPGGVVHQKHHAGRGEFYAGGHRLWAGNLPYGGGEE